MSAFVSNFGHHIKTRKDTGIRPKELQKLLNDIAGSKEEAVVCRMTLRSMMQAKYSTECTGHFGLAFDYYCHFTSPIRRYPDLQIHRIIKDHLRGRMTAAKASHYEEILDEVARHSSETERRAEEAERETEKLKKAQYMENRIGEVYDGIISGVTAWGMFVELDNSCEGCIRAASMSDDFYVYDENAMKLVGERYHKEYCLGQKVKIKVVGADRLTKTIDFMIYDETMDEDGESDDFVVYSESRKIQESKANKIRKLMERADNEPKEEYEDDEDADQRLVEYRGRLVDISEIEPDPRTGEIQLKKNKKASRSYDKAGKSTKKAKGKKDAEKPASGRKVYKVHKYKKSATSKAARSAQGKGRRKK